MEEIESESAMFRQFRRWLVRSYRRTAEQGWAGASKSAFQAYKGLWRAGTRVPLGTNVYEYDWDVLVVLDGCRVDLLCEVADEYEFIGDIDSIWSAGSHSIEWVRGTFTPEYRSTIEETTYVTANPHSGAAEVDWGQFGAVDEVWREGFDSDLGTVPPRTVTDRALHVTRNSSPEYLVVHYMQPHQPFIAREDEIYLRSPLDGSSETDDSEEWSPGDVDADNIWLQYRSGEVSRQEVWEAYRDTLRLVLDDVGLFLDNLDAGTVIITADHGNSVGEWGMYGHKPGFLHPSVRKVPWVTTTGRGPGDYVPPSGYDGREQDREEVLAALGYVPAEE